MEVYQGYHRCSVNKWITTDDHPGTISESIPVASKTTSVSENPPPLGPRRILVPIAWSPDTKVPEAQNRGEFWADYKFWPDEEKLWHILNDVFLLELGIEKDFDFYGYEKPEVCHAAGLVLRTCNREFDRKAIYERITWLGLKLKI
ncbi:hypothetical protein BDZ45DRAFT_454218 [Acephala macrosclerotiorum]|nr:hypothetical protein BDZ45DRAFT_454218 [Acephala macrosclerotiorum]